MDIYFALKVFLKEKKKNLMLKKCLHYFENHGLFNHFELVFPLILK